MLLGLGGRGRLRAARRLLGARAAHLADARPVRCRRGCAARHAAPRRYWSLALIAVLLLDPRAPLAAGFWLSFVAVGVILHGGQRAAAPLSAGHDCERRERRAPAMRHHAGARAAHVRGFRRVSLVGLAVNLVAIPLVSFVLVPLVLAGALAAFVAPALSHACFSIAASCCTNGSGPGSPGPRTASSRCGAPTPALWWFPFAMLAALVLLRRWPLALRVIGRLRAVCRWCSRRRALPEPGAARVNVLDAGRGSAALVSTHSHVLLFDTGDSWNTRGARLRRWVLPALDALRARPRRLLVLPALDRDRARGRRGAGIRTRGQAHPGRWRLAGDLAAGRRLCAIREFRLGRGPFQSFAAGAGGRLLRACASRWARTPFC